MDEQQFIANFREQFDMIDDDTVIGRDTDFRALEDWDSLVALSIIAMIDDEYGVAVSGDDIRAVDTVAQLMLLVKEKQ